MVFHSSVFRICLRVGCDIMSFGCGIMSFGSEHVFEFKSKLGEG